MVGHISIHNDPPVASGSSSGSGGESHDTRFGSLPARNHYRTLSDRTNNSGGTIKKPLAIHRVLGPQSTLTSSCNPSPPHGYMQELPVPSYATVFASSHSKSTTIPTSSSDGVLQNGVIILTSKVATHVSASDPHDSKKGIKPFLLRSKSPVDRTARRKNHVDQAAKEIHSGVVNPDFSDNTRPRDAKEMAALLRNSKSHPTLRESSTRPHSVKPSSRPSSRPRHSTQLKNRSSHSTTSGSASATSGGESGYSDSGRSQSRRRTTTRRGMERGGYISDNAERGNHRGNTHYINTSDSDKRPPLPPHAHSNPLPSHYAEYPYPHPHPYPSPEPEETIHAVPLPDTPPPLHSLSVSATGGMRRSARIYGNVSASDSSETEHRYRYRQYSETDDSDTGNPPHFRSSSTAEGAVPDEYSSMQEMLESSGYSDTRIVTPMQQFISSRNVSDGGATSSPLASRTQNGGAESIGPVTSAEAKSLIPATAHPTKSSLRNKSSLASLRDGFLSLWRGNGEDAPPVPALPIEYSNGTIASKPAMDEEEDGGSEITVTQARQTRAALWIEEMALSPLSKNKEAPPSPSTIMHSRANSASIETPVRSKPSRRLGGRATGGARGGGIRESNLLASRLGSAGVAPTGLKRMDSTRANAGGGTRYLRSVVSDPSLPQVPSSNTSVFAGKVVHRHTSSTATNVSETWEDKYQLDQQFAQPQFAASSTQTAQETSPQGYQSFAALGARESANEFYSEEDSETRREYSDEDEPEVRREYDDLDESEEETAFGHRTPSTIRARPSSAVYKNQDEEDAVETLDDELNHSLQTSSSAATLRPKSSWLALPTALLPAAVRGLRHRASEAIMGYYSEEASLGRKRDSDHDDVNDFDWDQFD